MADDQVKYSELVRNDNNNFQGLIDALNTVKAKINELREEGTRIRVSINGVSSATRDQQQALGQDAASAERLRNDLRQLTDEEARLKAAIAEANRMTKLQAQAEQAAAGSLNEMRAKYKLLVAEMGRYNLKTEEGRRKMQTTAAQARKLRDEIYKLEASYGQFGRNVGNYTGALSRFSARLKEAAARFVAFNAAFLSFTGGIRFAKEIYNVRKELESALVIFKALVGEVQGAKLFEQIKEFAFTTPVTLNAAAKAMQTMLSFGVEQEKAVDVLKRLGDIAAGDSDRIQRLALAYSQATQAGRLMGQDTLQFINAGFNPLYYISKRTGKSMMELRKEMQAAKIPIDQVTQAIIDATSVGGQFYGMLDKQKDTLKGAANIMAGAWQNMLNEMGEDMQSGMVGILKWLTDLMKNWRKTITTLREVAVSVGVAKASMLLYKAAVDAVTRATAGETAATVADTAATNVNITAKNLWRGAILSVKTAFQGLWKVMKANWVFALISGVTMLVQKLIDANTEIKRLTDYTEDFTTASIEAREGAQKEYKVLDQLFDELKKAKKGTDDFKTAKQNIIDQFGQYDSKLKDELTDVNNLDTAYQNLKIAIDNSYKARARNSFMESSTKRLSEAAVAIEKNRNALYQESTDENGNWKPDALRRHVDQYKDRVIQSPSDKGIIEAYEQLLSARTLDELKDNWFYTRYKSEGTSVYGVSEEVAIYIKSLEEFIAANKRADALWGEYKPISTPNFTPVKTGDGDDNKKRKPSGSFNNSYRNITTGDVLVEEANAMRDQGDNVLAEIQMWYDKKVAIANASYIKEKETLERERDERNKSLTDNLNKAIQFKSKYEALVAEVDKDPYLDEEGKAARKAELKNQLDEATALIESAETQRANIKDYYDQKELIAKQKLNNELADLDQQRTEKLFSEEQKRFKAHQDAEKRRFELDKHNSIERAKFDMEQEIASKNWQIVHAKDLKLSEEELAILKEEVEWLNKKYSQGNYNAKRGNTGNYSNIMDVLFGEKITSDQISALNSVFDQAKSALSSWIDARKEAADQAKELADDEVAAAENALNREIELRNQGYANDVALRERELADAKQKQKEALEMQQKAKKEELAINTAMEASNMAVAIANLFKQFGWYAIPLTAVMLGAWGATKISALNSIKSTKYREGGVMLLEGGSHQSGHDINLGIGPDGSNLRAEGGEYFAVINKRNSRRYGSEIPNIVNALNSGMFEDRYIKTSDAMGMLPRIIKADDGSAVDLSAVESGVGALVKQGERTWSTEGEYRVMRYKNLTRRVRIN